MSTTVDSTTARDELGQETPRRWFGVGRSSQSDARAAGDEAAAAALANGDAKLLVVFCSHAYDLGELLAGINERSGGVPLIGCSTAGEISTGGAGNASVVVSAFGGAGFSAMTGAVAGITPQLREAGAELATKLAEHPGDGDAPHRIFLLLTDGLAGDQEEIIRGAYSVVGASVPLVGGCAGDDLAMTKTFQLHGGEVLENAIVGAVLASDAPIGIGVEHGWKKAGDPMLITASEGTRLYALDDEPALDAYLKRLDAPQEAYDDPTALSRFALSHPLGLDGRTCVEVRFIGEANFEDRSLGCIAQVPQGGLAWFMDGDEATVLEATDSACAAALEPLPEKPIGLLVFDCVARKGLLGEAGIEREINQVAACAGGAPVAGFYSYGEIARTHGVNGLHNQTLLVLAFG